MEKVDHLQDSLPKETMTPIVANPKEPDSEEKPRKSVNEKQQDLLMMCISQDLGFTGGKPVAAYVIYKCLSYWRSFEVEQTSVLDRIIKTAESTIKNPGNNDVLAYWLCNASTLLMLLQYSLKGSGVASLTPLRRWSSSPSLFGRMSQRFRAAPQSVGLLFCNDQMLGTLDELQQVGAKFPALLFKQQLTEFVKKIYEVIRDNLKKEISPLLSLCIQAPRTSRASLVKGCTRANAVAQRAVIAHWQSIIKSLNNYVKILKAHYVPPFLVRKVFTQIFSFINVQLFNSLLLQRECCTFSNGEYVKSGLAELEQWCCYATKDYVGLAWDELKHIRQAVGFLVTRLKDKKTLNEIANELCPVLSIQQLYMISTMYWDDKYGTHSVSADVTSSMSVMMMEDSNDSVSWPFRLYDDSRIPFSVDDLSESMLIRENLGHEEKLSNLELENQVVCQQALTMSPIGKTISSRPRMTIIQRTPKNGNILNGEMKPLHEPESEEKPQKSLNEKQQENEDLLIKCISQDLGFSGGKPIAACVIYKCLLHWKSFEVERTRVFDCIIQIVGSAIEVPYNNDVLAYWLCNTSTLLMLLQHILKASGAASLNPHRRRLSSASLFGRMSQGLRASPLSAGLLFLNDRMLGTLDELQQVGAKFPALLFKQQLTEFVKKIYGMIRDNLKKEISALLSLCIQASRTSRASLVKGHTRANAVAQQAVIAYWQSIIKSLNNYVKILKAHYVPPFLVRKVFTQIFSFINVQLFNSLLLQRECCTFSSGEYVKSGLAELEQWCCNETEDYVGSARDELKHIGQAVGFLVTHQKPKTTLDEITNELCPVLNIQQLYRISTMYWDDKYGTRSVSADVISSMRVMMTKDSNNSVSSSLLLDDDSSIPFSVDDLCKSMPQVDLADVEPPPLIRENSEFVFLHQRSD